MKANTLTIHRARKTFFCIHKIIMDCTLVIPFCLIHVLSVCTGKALPEEKGNIELKIKTLMVRLNTFQSLPNLKVSPSAELGGYSSIVAAMDGYNSLISDGLLNVAQVKSDIADLTSIIHKHKNCTGQNPKLTVPRRLENLQHEWEQDTERHIEAVSLEALNGVKEIVQRLLKNFNAIASC